MLISHLKHTGKVRPRPWDVTQDPGPCGETLGWDLRTGPWGGTMDWDTGVGPLGGTMGWGHGAGP